MKEQILLLILKLLSQQTTPTVILVPQKSKWGVKMRKSVPLVHVEIVAVQKETDVGEESLLEVLIL